MEVRRNVKKLAKDAAQANLVKTISERSSLVGSGDSTT